MFPIALIMPILVTRDSRSVEVTAPTCLAPFKAIASSGVCVVKHQSHPCCNCFGRKVIPFLDLRYVFKEDANYDAVK